MIRIENLSFSYGEKAVFNDYSLDIPAGVVCIGGESGGGKTTLLHLLAGLLKPNAGAITGVPEKISLLFQDDRLMPWYTNARNVLVAAPGCDTSYWLGAVELEDEADSFPSDVSGGQRRRVALARALAFGGELLLLDEPFKGLDPALTERMAQLICKHYKNVIITTHSQFEAEAMGGKIITL